MTPEAEKAVRSALGLARRLRGATGPALASFLELALQLEGAAPEAPDPGPGEPGKPRAMTPTERWRKWKGKQEPTAVLVGSNGITANANAATNAATNGSSVCERTLLRTDPLDQELRDIGAMAGVQDIDAAWRKFTGHFADKFLHVPGRWQWWCAREAQLERTERERGRERASARGRFTPDDRDPQREAREARAKRLQGEAEVDEAVRLGRTWDGKSVLGGVG